MKNDSGDTVLSLAVSYRNIEMVKLLLENYVDVNIKIYGDKTVVDIAKEELEKTDDVKKQQSYKEIIELLNNAPKKLDKQLSKIEWEEVCII